METVTTSERAADTRATADAKPSRGRAPPTADAIIPRGPANEAIERIILQLLDEQQRCGLSGCSGAANYCLALLLGKTATLRPCARASMAGGMAGFHFVTETEAGWYDATYYAALDSAACRQWSQCTYRELSEMLQSSCVIYRWESYTGPLFGQMEAKMGCIPPASLPAVQLQWVTNPSVMIAEGSPGLRDFLRHFIPEAIPSYAAVTGPATRSPTPPMRTPTPPKRAPSPLSIARAPLLAECAKSVP